MTMRKDPQDIYEDKEETQSFVTPTKPPPPPPPQTADFCGGGGPFPRSFHRFCRFCRRLYRKRRLIRTKSDVTI